MDRDQLIRTTATRLGLQVDTHRPDGGRRRYMFTTPSGRTSSILHGDSDAEVYLEGYEQATEEKVHA